MRRGEGHAWRDVPQCRVHPLKGKDGFPRAFLFLAFFAFYLQNCFWIRYYPTDIK